MNDRGICNECFNEDRITEIERNNAVFLCRKCGHVSTLFESTSPKIGKNPFAFEYEI